MAVLLAVAGSASGCTPSEPATDDTTTGITVGPTVGGTTVGSTDDGTTAATADGTATAPTSTSTADDTEGPDTAPIFDVDYDTDSDTDGPPIDMCTVQDDMNAVGDCNAEAPPDSFEPDVQWVWTGGATGEQSCIVTALVANLTDDDGNGTIDLCDVPDVVVVAATTHTAPGYVFLLDGETGAEHMRFGTQVVDHVTPALGDIDDDGIPEIITVGFSDGRLVAFEHDGTVKWTGDTVWEDGLPNGTGGLFGDWAYGSVQLADVDTDGDVEIIAGNMLADHTGHTLWFAPEVAGDWNASTAADLDGDGDLEIVLGHAAFRHDGSTLWVVPSVQPGFPQVADLDGDGLPEVLVTNRGGISLIEHDGTLTYQDLRPTGVSSGGLNWIRPATIHDFDGDGAPEFAVSSQTHYTVYEPNGMIVWDAPVVDFSGVAGGTAFDFLGDGIAEAMYTDEQRLHVFDGGGNSILQIDRTSVTGTEYPVVADIDNDGSAEILVVSNGAGAGFPTVQAVRDVQDRWIQARRIWNQHAYHVTNVREDGTIPQFAPNSWEGLNTFRTQAQIEGGGICVPTPPG
ncbi:FG-GAP repeat domain-containing protein [Paraliomyxa miuraensis]|uniref:FG-GAP repeat domain-containing protein n=1 Tax=Paraliomyxa miuraensis TaxID=376150 RepID=UPI002257AA07|nr:VCBS repeat-containing protein [Paraliomyxa miuraensis]MCX4246357.1 VCBS repeat-containing protein [Paraliomyxa miuraensis]